MAHGQSNQCRRAGWLAAACGLVAAVGCHGPEKDPTLDPSTKQRLMALGQPPAGNPGTGNTALDQRFDRTVPSKLPSPQLASSNPPPAPKPAPSGDFVMPTQPTTLATFGGPQPPAEPAPRPQPLAEPVVQTGGIAPVMPSPLPTVGGDPEPRVPGPVPLGVLPVAPLQDLTPPEPGLAPYPPVPPPALPATPVAPPLPPEYRDSNYPPLPSPIDVPPTVK